MLIELLQPTKFKRVIFFLLSDISISIATILLSYLLRFNFDIPQKFFDSMFYMMWILISIKLYSSIS